MLMPLRQWWRPQYPFSSCLEILWTKNQTFFSASNSLNRTTNWISSEFLWNSHPARIHFNAWMKQFWMPRQTMEAGRSKDIARTEERTRERERNREGNKQWEEWTRNYKLQVQHGKYMIRSNHRGNLNRVRFCAILGQFKCVIWHLNHLFFYLINGSRVVIH